MHFYHTLAYSLLKDVDTNIREIKISSIFKGISYLTDSQIPVFIPSCSKPQMHCLEFFSHSRNEWGFSPWDQTFYCLCDMFFHGVIFSPNHIRCQKQRIRSTNALLQFKILTHPYVQKNLSDLLQNSINVEQILCFIKLYNYNMIQIAFIHKTTCLRPNRFGGLEWWLNT